MTDPHARAGPAAQHYRASVRHALADSGPAPSLLSHRRNEELTSSITCISVSPTPQPRHGDKAAVEQTAQCHSPDRRFHVGHLDFRRLADPSRRLTSRDGNLRPAAASPADRKNLGGLT